MKIIYPREYKKVPIDNGVKYSRDTPIGFEICFNQFYVNGYRQAIKDVKKLNK